MVSNFTSGIYRIKLFHKSYLQDLSCGISSSVIVESDVSRFVIVGEDNRSKISF